MRRLFHIEVLIALSMFCWAQAIAQRSSSATQVVTFSVHRSTGLMLLGAQSHTTNALKQSVAVNSPIGWRSAAGSQLKFAVASNAPGERTTAREVRVTAGIVGAAAVLPDLARSGLLLTVSD